MVLKNRNIVSSNYIQLLAASWKTTQMEVKYDKIGTDYNLTRMADNYLAEQFLYHLDPTKSGKYLDIGCGTGNFKSANK